jgi:pimeloyl-ACP methyl ester carboxylesterase
MRARCGDLEVSWGEWGRGDPLVLVHGLADDHRAWRRVLSWLALHRRVIACDVRGHGQTSLGEPDGTVGQLAQDLVRLLDVLAIDRADLAGFSMGGAIVLKTAIDHGDRVLRLFPIATSSRVGRAVMPWYAERARLADRGAGALQPVLRRDTVEQFATAPEHLEEHWLIRCESTADPRGFANGCRAMARLHAEPLDPDLGRITAPTLVISAERDQLCPPRAGEIIAGGVPGARLEVIPRSGHQVEIEQPEALSLALLGFSA